MNCDFIFDLGGTMSKQYFSLVGLFSMGCIPEATEDTTTYVDILFVMDNSSSMKEEAVSMGMNITSLFDGLKQENINANIGITTTSVDYSAGKTEGIDIGEAGLLTNGILNSKDNSSTDFREGLFCHATFWFEGDLPSNPSYNCGEDTEELTVEYLDCLCADDWSGISGSGNEEPIEAAYLALCRSTENPPEGCYDSISPFSDADETANLDFVRENATTVVVMIGDEADNSRRMQQGNSDPQVYIDLFSEFDQNIVVSGIGPNWDGNTLLCNSGGATTWAVERVKNLTLMTGGFYEPLETSSSGNDCSLVDFSEHMQTLLDSILTQVSPNSNNKP